MIRKIKVRDAKPGEIVDGRFKMLNADTWNMTVGGKVVDTNCVCYDITDNMLMRYADPNTIVSVERLMVFAEVPILSKFKIVGLSEVFTRLRGLHAFDSKGSINCNIRDTQEVELV